MNINGLFLGDKKIGSRYDVDRGFIDEQIAMSLEKCDIPETVIFSILDDDGEDTKNQLKSVISLAYRCLFEIKKKNIEQRRIYEIVCASQQVSSYAISGLENQKPKVEASQTMEVAYDDDRDLLILEYLLSEFENEYKECEELEEFRYMIDQYRLYLLSGMQSELPEDRVAVIKNILCKIKGSESTEIKVNILGLMLDVQMSPIQKSIARGIAKEYLVRIQNLIHNLNANFKMNDILCIYTDIPGFSVEYKKELREIGNRNHVLIEAFDDNGRAIAQGNAYYYYLVNEVFANRIKENIGRYSLQYSSMCLGLEGIDGSFTIVLENDFEVYPTFVVNDKKMNTEHIWKLCIPFFKCGDEVVVRFILENDSIILQACHLLSGEENRFTIKY